VPAQKRGGLGGPGLADLLDLLTEPSPAQHVRLVLKVYRDRGYAFEYAWAQALRSLPRSAAMAWWRQHLHSEKERWRAAYGLEHEHGQDDDERHDRAQRDDGEVSRRHGTLVSPA